MAIPGTYNTLNITKIVEFGVYLDGGDLGEILLPMKWVPENCTPQSAVEVFIYFDSENRIIATTQKPYAKVGDFAYLQVKAVNAVGAFLDWGLDKDLLVPYREQKNKLIEQNWYLVYVFSDEKGRIAASTYLEKFFIPADDIQEEQEVDLLIYASTDLGFKAIINNKYEGIIYANEVFQVIRQGQKLKGFIKYIRDDGKIDISLYKLGYQKKIDEISNIVLNLVKESGGFLSLTDKSTPEEIYISLGISKKNFKQAVGNLYKLKLIEIEKEGIRLI